MPRREIEDEVCLAMRVGQGAEDIESRWWSISQPRPSISLTLRARIGAALGPAADSAMRSMYAVLDPGTEDDLEQDAATLGDAAALQVFRRARSGHGIASIADGETPDGITIKAPMDLAAGRLLAVASFVARASGQKLDAALLLGEHDRVADNLDYKWTRPSLLHRLLLDSGLKFGGNAKVARYPSGRPGDTAPGAALFTAYNTGSITAFIREIDLLVSGPDELLLLTTWALLHLWRPF
jgi:hypothetical protein